MMITSKRKIYLFSIVVIILITISCTCGVPGLDTLFADEPTATVPPTKAPTVAPTATTAPTEEVIVPPTEAPEEPVEPEEQANVEILSDTTYTSDDWDYIVGEIINNTDTPMSGIKINVLLYDDHGQEYLEIKFTDGSHFKIRYDWIYEWEAA
ncbi:MAG: hypothetical protein MUO76_15835 [Anaerolineaceae bacterium]|nr:hypothetical protein [Anaerolineaceae bacterium]